MYGIGSVIDMKDEGRASYLAGMDFLEKVDESTQLTATPPPLPPKRNEQADAIGESVGKAILRILNLKKDEDDEEAA
jgi:hypothetical protein